MDETAADSRKNMPPQQQTESGLCDTLDYNFDFGIDTDADSMYGAGDFTSTFWYAESTLDIDYCEPQEVCMR